MLIKHTNDKNVPLEFKTESLEGFLFGDIPNLDTQRLQVKKLRDLEISPTRNRISRQEADASGYTKYSCKWYEVYLELLVGGAWETIPKVTIYYVWLTVEPNGDLIKVFGYTVGNE